MAGQVLEVQALLEPDRVGTEIGNFWFMWDNLRQDRKSEWREVRQYLYATDTRKTANSKLPWKNSTTLPKLCQIADNLKANYSMGLFPKRKSITWDAEDKSAQTEEQKKAVISYTCYMMAQKEFKGEFNKCINDYVEYGNAFIMPEWVDNRSITRDKETKVGYVGTIPRRISPLDIVFNPIAPSFYRSPKIIKSILTLGEVKKLVNSLTNDDNREAMDELWKYLREIRENNTSFQGDLSEKDAYLKVDGFTNYQMYLASNYVEILTFYGDIYDHDKDEFLENKIITIVDRHKVLDIKDNPSSTGMAPIYHVGWRTRPDNLWAMGPLDNLVGMQYRIDHIENLKADCFDLVVFPPLKIKGHVEQFEWGPMARIYIGDKDGDVEMLAPPFNILVANTEIQQYMMTMEEMAGSPKEAMGFRTPGEKTKYEVQRLENASSRIYQNKMTNFEENFVEEYLNGSLEMSRRKVTSDILGRYFDDELKINVFLSLKPEDLSGIGRIRPFAARHFAEQAELIQNLTSLMASPLGQIVQPHFASIRASKMIEELFNVQDYNLFQPYIALAEQADAQRIAQAAQEQVLMEAMTPGLEMETPPQPEPNDMTSTAPLENPPGYGTVPGSNFRTGPLGGGGYAV